MPVVGMRVGVVGVDERAGQGDAVPSLTAGSGPAETSRYGALLSIVAVPEP